VALNTVEAFNPFDHYNFPNIFSFFLAYVSSFHGRFATAFAKELSTIIVMC
jgi:hypothetical protein